MHDHYTGEKNSKAKGTGSGYCFTLHVCVCVPSCERARAFICVCNVGFAC